MNNSVDWLKFDDYVFLYSPRRMGTIIPAWETTTASTGNTVSYINSIGTAIPSGTGLYDQISSHWGTVQDVVYNEPKELFKDIKLI